MPGSLYAGQGYPGQDKIETVTAAADVSAQTIQHNEITMYRAGQAQVTLEIS